MKFMALTVEFAPDLVVRPKNYLEKSPVEHAFSQFLPAPEHCSAEQITPHWNSDMANIELLKNSQFIHSDSPKDFTARQPSEESFSATARGKDHSPITALSKGPPRAEC